MHTFASASAFHVTGMVVFVLRYLIDSMWFGEGESFADWKMLSCEKVGVGAGEQGRVFVEGGKGANVPASANE